jgi:phosphoribosyl-ATP pyrophosphohydrolase/phosphoribosyl-AMP cyclohydrolase
MITPDAVNWDKIDQLLPVIVQHAKTRDVLMLGYMNREALEKTIAEGKVTFFSRTKQRLWTKGESSGHFLHCQELRLDCDQDTLLIEAIPQGPTCHLGTQTCFGAPSPHGPQFLATLDELIATRRQTMPEGSYTTKLFHKGLTKIAQKVGEEGVETALAGVAESEGRLTDEAADLLYHLIVLLQARDLSLAQVIRRLQDRHQDATSS